MKLIQRTGVFHRWASYCAGLFVLLWLLSGMVLLFVPYPTLTERELAGLEPWREPYTRPVLEVERIEYDLWTVGRKYRNYRPFLKVSLDDSEKTILYWSLSADQWVQETKVEERFWNYFGAIPHWFYISVLRDHELLWNMSVWGASAAGSLIIVSGFFWYILRKRPKDQRKRSSARTWHAAIGSAVSLFLLAWLVSGFFSVRVTWLFQSEQPEKHHHAWWKSGGVNSTDHFIEKKTIGADSSIAWIEHKQVLGEKWDREVDRLGNVFWVASSTPRIPEMLPWEWVESELRRRMRNNEILYFRRIASNDFWVRDLPLGTTADESPMVRICLSRFPTEELDIDLRSGEVISRWNTNTRFYRILFRLLHTWDFPFFENREQLRKSAIISVLGTGVIVAILGIYLWIKRLKFRN